MIIIITTIVIYLIHAPCFDYFSHQSHCSLMPPVWGGCY